MGSRSRYGGRIREGSKSWDMGQVGRLIFSAVFLGLIPSSSCQNDSGNGHPLNEHVSLGFLGVLPLWIFIILAIVLAFLISGFAFLLWRRYRGNRVDPEIARTRFRETGNWKTRFSSAFGNDSRQPYGEGTMLGDGYPHKQQSSKTFGSQETLVDLSRDDYPLVHGSAPLGRKSMDPSTHATSQFEAESIPLPTIAARAAFRSKRVPSQPSSANTLPNHTRQDSSESLTDTGETSILSRLNIGMQGGLGSGFTNVPLASVINIEEPVFSPSERAAVDLARSGTVRSTTSYKSKFSTGRRAQAGLMVDSSAPSSPTSEKSLSFDTPYQPSPIVPETFLRAEGTEESTSSRTRSRSRRREGERRSQSRPREQEVSSTLSRSNKHREEDPPSRRGTRTRDAADAPRSRSRAPSSRRRPTPSPSSDDDSDAHRPLADSLPAKPRSRSKSRGRTPRPVGADSLPLEDRPSRRSTSSKPKRSSKSSRSQSRRPSASHSSSSPTNQTSYGVLTIGDNEPLATVALQAMQHNLGSPAAGRSRQPSSSRSRRHE
ncbi:hypothetical protein DFS34DRAFT_688823 [Phlyctochytrium arcticum]|nr:hypothetical protein DFS34DRAFT_688823 [Phlyctochytrium arcticum]